MFDPFAPYLSEVTHTDAIEEESEPPKRVTFEIVEDEPQTAEVAEKQQKEDVPKKEPDKAEVTEPKEAKSAKGRVSINAHAKSIIA